LYATSAWQWPRHPEDIENDKDQVDEEL
jgi:hypothetical protein